MKVAMMRRKPNFQPTTTFLLQVFLYIITTPSYKIENVTIKIINQLIFYSFNFLEENKYNHMKTMIPKTIPEVTMYYLQIVLHILAH